METRISFSKLTDCDVAAVSMGKAVGLSAPVSSATAGLLGLGFDGLGSKSLLGSRGLGFDGIDVPTGTGAFTGTGTSGVLSTSVMTDTTVLSRGWTSVDVDRVERIERPTQASKAAAAGYGYVHVIGAGNPQQQFAAPQMRAFRGPDPWRELT